MLIRSKGGDDALIEIKLEGELTLSPSDAKSLLILLADCPIRDQLVARLAGGEWYKMFSAEQGVSRSCVYELVSASERHAYTKEKA